ncbi:MAG: hypothetical protein V4563_14680 [Pseudomonadota bacterium]
MHEDDMSPGMYRRWKADPRNDEHGHQHICDYCETVWDCPQLWHCKRDLKSTCPDCLVKEYEKHSR